MGENTVTVELPASDWVSVLSAIDVTIDAEKEQDDVDTTVVETLTLLQEEIDRQFQAEEDMSEELSIFHHTRD